MALPRLLVTGASGFIGRHLLDRLKHRYEIYGMARRSQGRSGAPVHPNIRWFQVDIADTESLAAVFGEIRREGGVDTVIHLAAHYDFTGENHPEYWRTNVDGLRNVLNCCRDLELRRFIFSSSLAACGFPPADRPITESSVPDGDHVYARTKAIGERMLDEYRELFPSTIVRFAALFSDWCEYPPLFMFLGTWLSNAWNRRVLGGRGRSAIPYLHITDAIDFLRDVLERLDVPEHGDVLNCSRDGAVSHLDLFLAATQYYYGDFRDPVFLPKAAVGPGIRARCLLGRLTGNMPFERPWMGRYVDKQLLVDSKRTRELIGWEPRDRREIVRRMPFLLENLKAEPVEWNRRNRAAMKEVRMRAFLKIHSLLGVHAEEIYEEFTRTLSEEASRGRLPSYRHVAAKDHEWNHRLILRQLMNAVRTRERAVFLSYCHDLAERRYDQGFTADELCGALRALDRICLDVLNADPEAADVLDELHSHLTTTILFACDQVQETFERLEARAHRKSASAEMPAPPPAPAGEAPDSDPEVPIP